MTEEKIVFEIQDKIPDAEMTKYYETFEGKTLKHIEICLSNGTYFEAYIYLWSLIEQVLIKQLIAFVAKNLTIEIPSSLWKTNQVSINNFYLAISQDKELFLQLEDGRKKRNQLTHRLMDIHKDGLVDKHLREALVQDNKILGLVFQRLTGKFHIPSLVSYSKGWNDCVKQVNDNFDKLIRDFKKG